MTIRTSLIDYLGDSAEGDTIGKVLRTGLSAEGDTIAELIADAVSEPSDDDEPTTYTVTFDLNTGTGTAPDSVTGAAGTSVTLPDGTGITPPANKTFAGWGETSDAITALESYAISKDATLYAVYTG